MKKIFYALCLSCITLFILFGCKKSNNEMTTLNSKNELMSLLKQYQGNGIVAVSEDAVSETAKDASTDYSKTNTQENGVDESDVVKTDGSMIYLIRQHEFIIAKAYPISEAKVIKTINYDGTGFYPSSLYVDEDRIVVIGHYYKLNQDEPKIKSYYDYNRQMTKVMVYDKDQLSFASSEFTIDGYAVTSRKIGEELIVITNQYLYYSDNDESFDPRPKYQINGNEKIIDYDEIHYKEGTNPQSIVNVMKFNLKAESERHYTFLGSSDTVYVSNENIYITQREYQYRILGFAEGENPEFKDQISVTRLDAATLSKTKTVEVNGHVNNQFSMNEYEGNFRIVTTYGNSWDNSSTNHVYIFNQDLSLIGKVEGIAKGEEVQSVRFVDSRIYVVTFKTIDPFFVIDASNPSKPIILGELKIPGFSTYLHPYDDEHVVGFGFDTNSYVEKGQEVTRITGLKLSLYDVSDATSPINEADEVLPFGDSGYAYSELSYNHKALLFSQEKELIAFPLTTTKYKRTVVNEGGQLYSSYEYLYRQSYKVFKMTKDGFTYKTDISHFTEDKNAFYSNGYEILRGLYIEDYLYTISFSKMQIHRLSDYSLVKEVDLNFDEQTFYQYGYGYMID